MSSATDRLHAVIEPEIAVLGMDLENVALTPAGKRRVLTVTVDKDDGVGVDDIAEASRAVSQALDRDESQTILGTTAYTLEVSSPGADRPLTTPRHWRRNRNRLVNVTTHGGERFSGRIVDSDEAAAYIDVSGSRRRIGFDDVSQAVIQVELKRKDS